MTLKHPMDELPENHVLFKETMENIEVRYKDNMNHRYIKLNWEEVLSMTYQNVPYLADYTLGGMA